MIKFFTVYALFVFVMACSPIENKPNTTKVLELNYIADNVSIKEKGVNYIMYRYKNVRVDEVSRLASSFCNKKGLSAYLRDVVLDKSNYRIAAFDCGVKIVD